MCFNIYVFKNLYIKNNTMKKIIALISLFVITFTSSYAIVWNTTTINEDDLLKTQIFYINWQAFVKEEWKLVKVEWIKFYSINWVRYVNKNGKIEKMNEATIYKINNVNYVKENGKLKTLERYLAENPKTEEIVKKWTFSELYKNEVPDDLTLSTLNESKIEKMRAETLDEVSKMILEQNPNNTWTVRLLTISKQKELYYSKLKEQYFEIWEVEIAKKLAILENIEKIDAKTLNKAITAKLNNETITFKQTDNETDDELDTYDTTAYSSDDEAFNEIMNIFTLDNEEEMEFNSAEEFTDDTITDEEVIEDTITDDTVEEDTVTNDDTAVEEDTTTDDSDVDADMEEFLKMFEWL